MKTTQIIVAFLIASATGAPTTTPIDAPILESRQSTSVGTTANEYSRSGCKDIIFFFARGSSEIGNMGSTVGPPTGSGLKRAFGAARVAVEGIDYAALLSTNFNVGGADFSGIREMRDLLNSAASRCPNSILLAGGYSQGAALTHRAIEDLPTSVKNKIAGVVTYGDTRNLQDVGQIPNFPRDKVRVFCNVGDLVCYGTLTITAAHLDYVRRVPDAVAFLVGRVNAARA